MNQRIKELLVDSGVYECDVNDPDFLVPATLSKFAELLIRDCAEKIAHNKKFNWLDCAQAAKDLKEHFGVEE